MIKDKLEKALREAGYLKENDWEELGDILWVAQIKVKNGVDTLDLDLKWGEHGGRPLDGIDEWDYVEELSHFPDEDVLPESKVWLIDKTLVLRENGKWKHFNPAPPLTHDPDQSWFN